MQAEKSVVWHQLWRSLKPSASFKRVRYKHALLYAFKHDFLLNFVLKCFSYHVRMFSRRNEHLIRKQKMTLLKNAGGKFCTSFPFSNLWFKSNSMNGYHRIDSTGSGRGFPLVARSVKLRFKMAADTTSTSSRTASLSDLPGCFSVSWLNVSNVSLKSRQQGYKFFAEGYFHMVCMTWRNKTLQVAARCHPSQRKSKEAQKLSIDIDVDKARISDTRSMCSCQAG